MIMALIFNILFDYFISNISATSAKIAASPYMSPPETFSNTFKLLQQYIRAFALKSLYQTTYCNLRRNRNHYMNMIRRDVALQNINTRFTTFISNYIPYSLTYWPNQYLMAILSNPHQM